MTFTATGSTEGPADAGLFLLPERESGAPRWAVQCIAEGFAVRLRIHGDYLYALERIEHNVEVEEFSRAGVVSTSAQVTRLLDGAK